MKIILSCVHSVLQKYVFGAMRWNSNYRGNRVCLLSCYHRNACSVLCARVATRLANCYLVMGDFSMGTIFIQPLTANGRLRLLRYSCFVGEKWAIYPVELRFVL
jgi:hypothetical protein